MSNRLEALTRAKGILKGVDLLRSARMDLFERATDTTVHPSKMPRAKGTKDVVGETAPIIADLSRRIESMEADQRVRTTNAQLVIQVLETERQQHVALSIYVFGKTISATAELLGVSETTVKRDLRSIAKQLSD